MQGFNKSERLKEKALFKNLFSDGKYYRNSDISLRLLPNKLKISRLGISAQKRIFANATDRNRVKRLIREVFRHNKSNMVKGYDLLIKPKNLYLAQSGYKEMEACLLQLFHAAGILE